MILIIGGAYQGKLDYAKEKFGLRDEDIFDCAKANDGSDWPSIDLKAKALNHFERYTQGVVPMDKLERAWREETGRSLVILGKEAEKVIRVFCGIPQEIKAR